MINFNAPKFNFNLPWWMFDLDNLQLITSRIIPSDITDTKDIVLAENPIPGLNFSPVNYGGGGNRKLSFTLPLIKRNNTVGNVLMLKQIDQLRNQSVGLFGVFGNGQFTPTPRVLYSWGVGSVPLPYWVKSANATHKEGWTNELGHPQYSEIALELWLDETSPLYKGEEVFRKLSAVTSSVSGVTDTIANQKPY